MPIITVTARPDSARGQLVCGSFAIACSLGARGITRDKTEGDRATPAGLWPLRRVFFRPDRLPPPRTGLPVVPIERSMGWADDPADPVSYNRLVRLPHAGSHERLWREDGLYDIIVELGYNDTPPIVGRGSAIFLHVARPDRQATEGCVSVTSTALEHLLTRVGPGDAISIDFESGQG